MCIRDRYRLEQFDALVDARHALEREHESDSIVLQRAVDLLAVQAEAHAVSVVGGDAMCGLDHAQSSAQCSLGAIPVSYTHLDVYKRQVGTGVIDMRYENPLYLAEEAASLDLISSRRIALGISRGSPETALRGYEAFGYTGSEDPRGGDIARDKFELFLHCLLYTSRCV